VEVLVIALAGVAIFKGMARLIEEDDSIDSPPDLLATTCAEWTLQHAQETIA
jgi:hypothetical protein